VSAWRSAFLALLACACGDNGQERVTIPLYVAGSDVLQPIAARGGVPVTLERADLAFGPLYLCAGATAGDLCDTARVEWLGTVVVNALEPNPTGAGDLTGVTGTVRSWMYDLGISSQLTRSEPFVLDAARELGDTSLLIAGRADVGGVEMSFDASVRVAQTDDTELGVPVVRKSTTESFRHEVTRDEAGLTLRFDPAAWVQGVDFASFCGPDGECFDHVTLGPDTEAFRSLRNALVSGGRPSFEWRLAR
jgi:hypothetical protein